MKAERSSDVVYLVARFVCESRTYWLLRRHEKWGDWSLIGGHVEPEERDDWDAAARREANEEMAPLRVGVELDLVRLPVEIARFQRVSRSAKGKMTDYAVRWYALTFQGKTDEGLRLLPAKDFLMVAESELEGGPVEVGEVVGMAPVGVLPEPVTIQPDTLAYLEGSLARRSPVSAVNRR